MSWCIKYLPTQLLNTQVIQESLSYPLELIVEGICGLKEPPLLFLMPVLNLQQLRLQFSLNKQDIHMTLEEFPYFLRVTVTIYKWELLANTRALI